MDLDTINKFTESINIGSPTNEMTVYGNRPGDIIARQKKLAETLPEKPGIIASKELRPGDKVPCRTGDIIAGVCKAGQTARDAEIESRSIISKKFIEATIDELEEKVHKQICTQAQAHPRAELALCP